MKRLKPNFSSSNLSDALDSGGEQEEIVEKRRKKKAIWKEDSERLLIQLWHEYVGSLRANRKNSIIYQEMVNEMSNDGHNFTVEEIRFKLHNLTNKYKLEKRQIAFNGGYSSWCYYDDIHQIYTALKREDSEPRDEPVEHRSHLEIEDIDTNQEGETMCSTEAMENYKTEEENKDNRGELRYDRSLYGSDILKMLRDCTEIMKREALDRRRTDSKMLRLQEELVEIERERNDILKEMLSL